MPTIPIENYLIAIQTLRDEGIRCIPARIAERMEVSAPTVTETVKRMERDGYLVHGDGREIGLSERGRDIALNLMRRHRMVERWLTDVLQLDLATAHEEAHKLEHAISDVVADRLWRSMGCPDSCPHGNPIVELDPAVIARRVRLRDIDPGCQAEIQRISELAEDNHELMVFLEQKNFRPGVVVTVTDRGPLRDTFTVDIGGSQTTISSDVAGFIWVCPQERAA